MAGRHAGSGQREVPVLSARGRSPGDGDTKRERRLPLCFSAGLRAVRRRLDLADGAQVIRQVRDAGNHPVQLEDGHRAWRPQRLVPATRLAAQALRSSDHSSSFTVVRRQLAVQSAPLHGSASPWLQRFISSSP